ncbi:MAG: hypothetical protein H7210_01575 [Pyrinomonadaceae bacterium]|nr:hypothetical protein [Phycisphaerales bacterium]
MPVHPSTSSSEHSARSVVTRAGASRGGFTLIETALATVIVGLGVLALIDAQQSFMKSNDWSSHAATATYLANEVRELTRKLPKHDPVTGLWLQVENGVGTLRGWGPDAGETEVDDFDDLDDFDGITFSPGGAVDAINGELPGPIDAFGTIIPEILVDGTVPMDENDNALPLQGWTQTVSVEKVDPYDTSVVRSDAYVSAAIPPNFPGLSVDKFPLRVTVVVRYQGPLEARPTDVATVVWIVP